MPLTPKEAYEQLAAETIADQGVAIVPLLVASLQPSPDEVHSCIVHALELCGDERALRALMTAREGVRNDGLTKRENGCQSNSLRPLQAVLVENLKMNKPSEPLVNL